MKHILAEKTNNENFTFCAAPIPNNLPPQYSVEDKKTLELKHGGEDYAVYCDANLTDNELKKLKHDWEDVDPQSLNIVMSKK